MAATQKEIQFYITDDLSRYFRGAFATNPRIETILKTESPEIAIPDAKKFDAQFDRDPLKLSDATHLFQLQLFYGNVILFPILERADLSESQQTYLWLRQLYDLMRISADNNIELPETPNSNNAQFNALYKKKVSQYKKMLAENFADQNNKEFQARQFMADEIRRFVVSMPKWEKLANEKEQCKKIIDEYCGSGSGVLNEFRYKIFASDIAKVAGHNYEANAVALKSAIDKVVTNHSLRELVIDEFQNICRAYNEQRKKKSGYLVVLEKVLKEALRLEDQEVLELEKKVALLKVIEAGTAATVMKDKKESATESTSSYLANKKRGCKKLIAAYCEKSGYNYETSADLLVSAIEDAVDKISLEKTILDEYQRTCLNYKKQGKEPSDYLDVIHEILTQVLRVDPELIVAVHRTVDALMQAEADTEATIIKNTEKSAMKPKLEALENKRKQCKELIKSYCGNDSGGFNRLRFKLRTSSAKIVGLEYQETAVKLLSAIDSVSNESGLESLVIAEFKKIYTVYNDQGKKKDGYLAVLENVLKEGLDLDALRISAIEGEVHANAIARDAEEEQDTAYGEGEGSQQLTTFRKGQTTSHG